MPFNSEKQRREIVQLAERTGIRQHIRLIFMTESPFSISLRPTANKPQCPPTCITCATAEKRGMCFKKNCVYHIKCQLCFRVYIGESKRCIRSRIKEDLTGPTEHVFLHSLSHSAESIDIFKWKVLSTVSDLNTRRASEAFFIRKFANNLINGCNGKDILHFLNNG